MRKHLARRLRRWAKRLDPDAPRVRIEMGTGADIREIGRYVEQSLIRWQRTQGRPPGRL